MCTKHKRFQGILEMQHVGRLEMQPRPVGYSVESSQEINSQNEAEVSLLRSS